MSRNLAHIFSFISVYLYLNSNNGRSFQTEALLQENWFQLPPFLILVDLFDMHFQLLLGRTPVAARVTKEVLEEKNEYLVHVQDQFCVMLTRV